MEQQQSDDRPWWTASREHGRRRGQSTPAAAANVALTQQIQEKGLGQTKKGSVVHGGSFIIIARVE